MEGYVLFHGRREAASCEEQEEDIGCPSDSEMSATDSMLSSSGEELEDDATSSSGSSGSTESFEMSSLMAQLPLKRGLSKFFDGKSQSFASLAAVGGLEDLAKPPSKRIRTSRSCEVGLQDAHRRRFAGRNAAAFKKVSKGRAVDGGVRDGRPHRAPEISGPPNPIHPRESPWIFLCFRKG